MSRYTEQFESINYGPKNARSITGIITFFLKKELPHFYDFNDPNCPYDFMEIETLKTMWFSGVFSVKNTQGKRL